MRILPRIVITPGEPAGIGPDITIKVAQKSWPAELIVVGDPDLLIERAKQLKLPLKLELFDNKSTPHKSGVLKIIPAPVITTPEPGKLNKDNSRYVLNCLEIATDQCLAKNTDALVTGPIHKGIINDAGIHFSGHTEFLAARCQAKAAMMLFVAEHLRVALATTHIPLAQVPKTLTEEKLMLSLRLLNKELKSQFAISNPKIYVCGLNPHAGEQGHLGKEEIEIIEPALKKLRQEQLNVIGPLPADTIFTQKYLNEADAIFAMYHDQALPVVKYLGFGQTVNVTLGLPIIRTSVDHGTALDIAGTGQADESSLAAAIQLAIKLFNASE